MARFDQVIRILKVISLLERNPAGFSVGGLHKRLLDEGYQCSRRSVYRDLEAIEQAHFPITKEGKGEDLRWMLDSIATVTPSIQISYRELLALFIARGSLDFMKGSPIYDAIQSFFARIEKVLGAKAQEGLSELESYLGFKARPAWQSGVSQAVLDTIHQACSEGHQLQIEYRSVSGDHQGEVKIRKVGPEAIYFADAGAYLVAKDLQSGAYKTYALARVRAAVLLEGHYETHGFVVKDFLKDGIGVFGQGQAEAVEIEITEPLASYISERCWHESQEITRTENGIRLKMTVKVNDELVRWILGLGVHAYVVAPFSLRKNVIEAVSMVSRKYPA